MKQQYKEIKFRPETEKLIYFLDAMIADYQSQGFTLSVRQLYYQLVARDKIPNTEQSYKRIASIINDARVAGMLDWDAIEDRGRDIEVRSRWTSGGSILRAVANQFHMDLWDGQDYRVFVIVEKAALAGVLGGTCKTHDVPLLAARGYPSVSIMREFVMEHFLPSAASGQTPVILHLGDHDPSGIDMTRDLRDRISMFMEGSPFELHRIALTMAQVEEVQPPPNPAKTSDSRFDGYAELYGDESWELDALPPAYINELVTGMIEKHIDHNMLAQREDEIADVKLRLQTISDEFDNA